MVMEWTRLKTDLRKSKYFLADGPGYNDKYYTDRQPEQLPTLLLSKSSGQNTSANNLFCDISQLFHAVRITFRWAS